MMNSAVAWSWTIRGLDPSTRLVLIALATRAKNGTYECFPAHKTLAAETEVSVSTVRRSLAKLEARGALVVTARKRTGSEAQTSNRYHLAVNVQYHQPTGEIVQDRYERDADDDAETPIQNEQGGVVMGDHPPLLTAEHPRTILEGTISGSKEPSTLGSSVEVESELPLGLEPLPPKDPTPADLAEFIAEQWKARPFVTPMRGGKLTEDAREKAFRLASAHVVEGGTVLDVWREIFENIDQSDWLQGKVQGSDGRAPFRLTLSFLLDKPKFVKTLESRYNGKSSGERRTGSTGKAVGRVIERLRAGGERSAGGGNPAIAH